MKFFKYLLLALPLLGFTSCNSDDEAPDLTMYAQMYGFYYSESKSAIFVLPDDELVIESLKVTDANDKNVLVSYASYSVNGEFLVEAKLPPYGCVIPTEVFSYGSNVLGISAIVAPVGYDILQMWSGYEITALADEDQLPDDAVYYPVPDNSLDKEENQ